MTSHTDPNASKNEDRQKRRAERDERSIHVVSKRAAASFAGEAGHRGVSGTSTLYTSHAVRMHQHMKRCRVQSFGKYLLLMMEEWRAEA
jgi:hypothetical protein